MTTHVPRLADLARRAACIALAALGVLGSRAADGAPARSRAPAVQRDSTTVDELRAVFVHHFATRHVRWPDSAFADRRAPFVVGVLGKDPITPLLVAILRERKYGDRAIEVRRLDDVDQAAACHIVYVPANREPEIDGLVRSLRDRPTLVVAANRTGVDRGAHIGFFLEKSFMKFAVRLQATKRAKLEVTSEALKLADVVDEKEGGRK